jgi:LysR family transcriptional regulator, regulator for bpeEF and oprC
MDNMVGLLAFVRTAEALSFAAAARQLGQQPSTVAKAVGRLEERLGARLLARTTRAMSLTVEGEALLRRARAILDDLAEAEAEVIGARGEASGLIRIAAVGALWRSMVLPWLADFLQRHPRVSVSYRPAVEVPDLARDGIDIALQIDAPADGRVIAPLLAQMRLIIAASPAYLARRGAPTRIADLFQHERVAVRFLDGRAVDWTLLDGDRLVTLPPGGRVDVTVGEAVLDAAVAGLGLVMAPSAVLAPAIASGALVRVLPDVSAMGPPVHAVYLPGATRLPKIALFLEALRAYATSV